MSNYNSARLIATALATSVIGGLLASPAWAETAIADSESTSSSSYATAAQSAGSDIQVASLSRREALALYGTGVLVSLEQTWDPGDEVGVVIEGTETVVPIIERVSEGYSRSQSRRGTLVSLNQEWDPGDTVLASATPPPPPEPEPEPEPAPEPEYSEPAVVAPTPIYTPAPSPLGASSDIAATALQYVGYPYVWGATGPGSFDCSGFVQYVFGLHGISLPRISGDQGRAGTPVSAAEAKAGDLVVWGESHIAIYLRDGQIVHASTPATGVKVSSLYGSYYFSRIS